MSLQWKRVWVPLFPVCLDHIILLKPVESLSPKSTSSRKAGFCIFHQRPSFLSQTFCHCFGLCFKQTIRYRANQYDIKLLMCPFMSKPFLRPLKLQASWSSAMALCKRSSELHRGTVSFEHFYLIQRVWLITGPSPSMQANSRCQPSSSIPGSAGWRPSENISAFFKLHLPSFSLRVILVLMMVVSSERNKWEMLPSEKKSKNPSG